MRLLCLILLSLSPFLKAEVIRSQVYDVSEHLVRFTNGRVAFLTYQSIPLYPREEIEAVVDDSSNIISFKKIGFGENHLIKMSLINEEEPIPFEPSLVPNMEEANRIFNRSNPYFKRISECTDRAHVWAHDEFKYSGTKSMKAFVFFTASYINSVGFKWWFHVAPMYKVKVDEKIEDLVMDFRYTDGPLRVKEWTDKFVYTKRPCKVTTKFSEYDVNPQTENCYLIFESMHYKIPGEIHLQELEGKYKNKTSEFEIQSSRKLAFLKRN